MKNLALGCLSALTVLGLASCGGDGNVPGGSGFIEATEVTVSAQVTGTVERRYFDEGDQVSSGATLALIDTTTYALQLAEAQAQLHAAETREGSARLQVEKAELDSSLAGKEYERIDNLVAKGSASQQQYDRAETIYRQAAVATGVARAGLRAASADIARIRAGIDVMRKHLEDCRPSCPLAGTVVTTYVEPGELVAAGRPILKVADLDTVWVKIYLPPRDLTRINLRGRALVDPEDGRPRPLDGWVSWIASEAEFTPKNVQTKEARADLVYAVKVTVPNPGEQLKIGMPVAVELP
jgi:HlyD family secretion protein